MNATSIGKYISWAIIGVSVIVIFAFLIVSATGDWDPELKGSDLVNSNSYIVWFNYVLAGLAAVLVVVFFVMEMISNTKLLIGTLSSLLIVGIIALISFFIASNEIPTFLGAEKFQITATTSKMVGTSIISIYIFLGLAVAGIIYAEVSKFFK